MNNKFKLNSTIIFLLLATMLVFSLTNVYHSKNFLAENSYTKLENKQLVKNDFFTKDWTCMVYLDADNNLDSYGLTDINEMEMVGSSSQVNIIVLLDREYSGASTYYIEKDSNSVTISSSIISIPGLPLEPNMGDPVVLKTFVEYIMNMYPANNYLLDLWDHGSGWETYYEDEASSPYDIRSKEPVKGICYDDTNGNDALNTDELGSVLADLPDKIDVLSFDACLMAASELAYEYRNYVDYMVASEETIPGNGYNYQLVFNALVNNPTMSPAQFSQTIVDKYAEAYAYEPSTTLSAIDCSKMDAFATALNAFAQAMISDISSCVLGINRAWMDVEYFTVVSYIELAHFCDLVISNVENSSIISSANALKTAINNAVIRNHHGSNHPEAKGLSIYFPFIQTQYSDKYEERIDLTSTTLWDEFLKAYWAAGGGGGLSFQQYIIDDDNNGLSSGNSNGIINPGEVVEITISARNNGLISATNVEGMLVTSDDYIYTTTFFCDFPDFAPGETHTSLNSFVLSIDSTCPAQDYFISFLFAFYSDQYGEQTFHNSIAVGISDVQGGGFFTDAYTLANGQTVSSTINGTELDECIWFKVEVPQGYRLLATMTGEAGTDFDMQIYFDQQVFLIGESVLLSYPEVINIVASKTGYYYIKVYSFEGSGEFSISIQITESGGINYGSNIGDVAIPVESGTYSGILPGPSPWGTVFYRFEGKANKKCTFTLTGPPGSIFDLVLYDLYGNEIAWTTTQTSNYPVELTHKLEFSGRYYLEVESYTGSGSYTIKFKIRTGLGTFLGMDVYWWIMIGVVLIIVLFLFLQSKGIIKINLTWLTFILNIFNSCNCQTSSYNSNNSNYNSSQNQPTNNYNQQSNQQITSRKRCPYCKTRIHPGQTNCPRCGKKV